MSYNVKRNIHPSYGRLLFAVATIDPKEIGKRIAQARDAKGWTQLTLAYEANVSPSSIQRWEAGRLPPVRELIRLAGLLGIEPEQLVETAADGPTDLRRSLNELKRCTRSFARFASSLNLRLEIFSQRSQVDVEPVQQGEQGRQLFLPPSYHRARPLPLVVPLGRSDRRFDHIPRVARKSNVALTNVTEVFE